MVIETLKSIVDRLLGIRELKDRMDYLEHRMSNVEGLVEASLKDFGKYRTRTTEELRLMKGNLENLLTAVDAMIDSATTQRDIDRGKSLRRRLKGHLTRANKAMTGAA